MEVSVFYSLFAGTDGVRTEFILWCLATIEGNIHKLSVLLMLLWPEEQAFVGDLATHSSSCLENPRGGGAWWAAIYGVQQSQTRLK